MEQLRIENEELKRQINAQVVSDGEINQVDIGKLKSVLTLKIQEAEDWRLKYLRERENANQMTSMNYRLPVDQNLQFQAQSQRLDGEIVRLQEMLRQ